MVRSFCMGTAVFVATTLLACTGDESGWSLSATDDHVTITNGPSILVVSTGSPGFEVLSSHDGAAKTVVRTSDGTGEMAAASVITRVGTPEEGNAVDTPHPVDALKFAGPVTDSTTPSASFSMMSGNARIAVMNVTPSGEDGFRIEMVPDMSAFDDPVASFGFAFDIESMEWIYGQGILTNQKNYREQQYHEAAQHFPMNAGSFERPFFTTDEGTNIVTPLWLTSKGLALFMDSYSVMSLSFNRPEGNPAVPNGVFRMHVVPAEGERSFALDFMTSRNTVEAYRKWVTRRWTFRPDLPVGGRPDDELFTRPIWTSWAEFKSVIDRDKIVGFADGIISHGYDAGVIEIDDKWTAIWGDLRFDESRFPDAAGMIADLKSKGCRVTAWIPPFVNIDASDLAEGTAARAFAAGAPDAEYPAMVGWWNTGFFPMAATIDFTTEEGRAWWGGKVDRLVKDYGLDGFKYDAGETCFLPKPVTLGDGVPFNAYPDMYASWGIEHRAAELRAAWFAQDMPVLMRMFDKNSVWGLDNGLESVLTQYLSIGMIGYPFIMPDMLGGNEYGDKCDDELMIRWAELNALLPCIQYSILPWRDSFAASTNETVKKFHDLRMEYADEFLRLADEAARTQMPIVRPLFFVFPDDDDTYPIGDQFMLGDRYLVAPVLKKGAVTRDVYLPAGTWVAIDDPSETHAGPILLKDYPAPIDRLPAFELQTH